MKNSRKQVTADIRPLLFCYMEFAIYSSMRPGTELDHLTWSDIQVESHGHKSWFYITVRKEKTTKHTGTRQVDSHKGFEHVGGDLAIGLNGWQHMCHHHIGRGGY